MNALLAFALAVAPRAAAEIYPIAPVSVLVRAEPDRTVVDIDADSIYWIEEVLEEHPLAPDGWSASTRAKAEAYVNAHLRLSVDGRRLSGRLLGASYRQALGQVNEQGRVRLRLAYPALDAGATLSGAADFYEEYRQGQLRDKQPLLPNQIFETDMLVAGRRPRAFVLVPGADSFTLPATDALLSRFERARQSVQAGAEQVVESWAAWPALLALALSLGPRPPSRARAAALLAAATAAAALPIPTPERAFWAAGAAAALGAGRWLAAGTAPWLEAAAAAALARAWLTAALPELPRSVPGPLERGLAAVGALAAAAALLTAGVAAVGAERRRMSSLSQARADVLFERRRRLAATALGIACVWGALHGGMR
ncbi:MAG: hypothetical protein HKL90_14915 [Elusimicrobia bacterium]|nr:hypothetical protein [Elusimicrobiota bacterium]